MNTFAKVLRALLGALIFALGWALFAWLASGRWEAALLLAVWTLLVAPLLLPDVIFAWARLRKRIQPLNLDEASPFRDLVLQCVLAGGKLRPRFWIVEAGDDQGFIWFERGWGSRRRQDIVLSRSWLAQVHEGSRSKEFRALWADMVSLAPGIRRLRTFEFRLWFGAFCLLDSLFDILHFLMRTLGLRDMPHPAFWCQRLAWSCKRAWFGIEEKEFSKDPFARHALRVDEEPLYWKSWVYGVWSRYPTRVLHPAWRVLVEASGLIES